MQLSFMRAFFVTFAMLFPQTSTPLVRYRDKARPVLIFTPGPSDPRFLTQLRTLESHTDGLAERQVVLLVFPSQHGSWHHPRNPAVWPDTPLDPTRMRTLYRIAPQEFTVILIGKDGGEKLRSHEPIPYETLLETIDAMPMRQQEMRHP